MTGAVYLPFLPGRPGAGLGEENLEWKPRGPGPGTDCFCVASRDLSRADFLLVRLPSF